MAWPVLEEDMVAGGWDDLTRRSAIIIPAESETAETIDNAIEVRAVIQISGTVGLGNDHTIRTFAVDLTATDDRWEITGITNP